MKDWDNHYFSNIFKMNEIIALESWYYKGKNYIENRFAGMITYLNLIL